MVLLMRITEKVHQQQRNLRFVFRFHIRYEATHRNRGYFLASKCGSPTTYSKLYGVDSYPSNFSRRVAHMMGRYAFS